jgi:sec-independent protein translocase protein TatB
LKSSWDNGLPPPSDSLASGEAGAAGELALPPPDYKHPKKNWRLKRGAMPAWYKQRQGIRTKALSGAARVARFRPKPLSR